LRQQRRPRLGQSVQNAGRVMLAGLGAFKMGHERSGERSHMEFLPLGWETSQQCHISTKQLSFSLRFMVLADERWTTKLTTDRRRK